MKASEYIKALEELVKKHGDLECVDADDEIMQEPEEVEGAFVLASVR